MADQDPVAEFVAITGADTEHALPILETVHYDVEAAVNLFFASQDPGSGPAHSSGSPTSFPDSVMDDEDYLPPAVPNTTQDRLIEHPSREFHALDWRTTRQHVEAMGGLDGAFDAASVLGRLFHPPAYALQGTLEQAKTAAVQQGKWLLVNMLGSKCFQSQQLNRDTWANDSVQATVVPFFVFWQQDLMSENGARFASLYHIHEVPTCVILDPRTGEAIQTWTGFLDHNQMADRLTSFLDHNLSLAEHDLIANTSDVGMGVTAPPAGPTHAVGSSVSGAPLVRRTLASHQLLTLGQGLRDKEGHTTSGSVRPPSPLLPLSAPFPDVA